MRLNSKDVKTAIIEHIIHVVNCYEVGIFSSKESIARYILSEFDRVANYPRNIQMFPNHYNRFSDYLQGLPFNFLFYYADISSYLISIGLDKQVSKCKGDNDKIQKLYHNLIYSTILRLAKNGK
jgi:hypothetical protein